MSSTSSPENLSSSRIARRTAPHTDDGVPVRPSAIDPAEQSFFERLQVLLHREERPLPEELRRICSVDASYERDSVVAVSSLYTDGRLSEQESCSGRCTFPYVSGLFYLREGPFVVEAVDKLRFRPELVCFDAHGVAHPRGAGLARIAGMVLGIPSIGIAKSRLVGSIRETRGGKIFSFKGSQVGFATETGRSTRYWSPGYSVSIPELRSVIERYGWICLDAMAASHRSSKERLSAGLCSATAGRRSRSS